MFPIIGQDAGTPPMSSVPIAILNQKHAFYRARERSWVDLHYMYECGDSIRDNASRFLRPRPKEPRDLLSARLERFVYEPVLPDIIGWYKAKLFREQPQIQIRNASTDGSPGPALDPKSEQYFADLMRDCNGASRPFLEELQEVFCDAALYKTGWLVLDRPNTTGAQSYAEQLDAGYDKPHLVRFDPLMVYDWSEDPNGNLDWVKIGNRQTIGSWNEKPKAKDVWYILTRTQYFVYEAPVPDNHVFTDDNALASLADQGEHAMASLNRVPVQRLTFPDDYCLGNRIYLLALSHINALNELKWALMMSNLYQTVIISDDDVKLVRSEAAYIQLGKDSRLETTEPSGRTFKTSQEDIDNSREQMYRSAHIIHMGRSSSSSPMVQSGVAKQQEMTPSSEVLEGIGKMIGNFIIKVTEDLGAIRAKLVATSVIGFSFVKDTTLADLESAQAVLDAGIPSDTGIKELKKKMILRELSDLDRETREKIVQEIDDSTPESEMRAAAAAQQQEQMAAQMSAAVLKFNGGPPAQASA